MAEAGDHISVTLTDPDLLDCPICLQPLASPVYQCANGLVLCESCCTMMSNKCASCRFPIGYANRCRALEKILESFRFSCQNAKHGCDKYLTCRNEKLDHENTCEYAPCHCPHPHCTYVVGSSQIVYHHFALRHSTYSQKFFFDSEFSISLGKDEKHIFLQAEGTAGIIFVLNRFVENYGSIVNVICIAPTSSNKEFTYFVTATNGVSKSRITLKSVADNCPQWTQQPPPTSNYVILPNYCFTSSGLLNLEVTIRSTDVVT